MISEFSLSPFDLFADLVTCYRPCFCLFLIIALLFFCLCVSDLNLGLFLDIILPALHILSLIIWLWETFGVEDYKLHLGLCLGTCLQNHVLSRVAIYLDFSDL